jgi:hypothetical protein
MSQLSTNPKVLKYIKNCPRLIRVEDVADCNFDFTDEFYQTFQNFLYQNPGKTTKELCQMITFYTFTPKTLEIAFKMFNTWKNTFYGICGPFICKDNRWFPIYAKKYTDTLLLAQENSKLRQKIKELENKITTLSTW